ncbi:MAG: PIN domain-containing protein [Raoultibacter sp.]
MKFLLDTNVALDLLLARKPFVAEAIQIFALAEAQRFELLLSTDAISTIFYVIEKNKGAKVGRQALATLLDFVSLAALDEPSVLQGLALDFSDVEDALVAAVASKEGARAIITRNLKDFKTSPITALSPQEFLAFWATEMGSASAK